jgi:hypothetical protein
VTRRRSLTPSPGIVAPGVRPARRAGGARHEVSYRIALCRDGQEELPGWALNLSRGGLRGVVEAHVEIGEVYEVVVGDELVRRPGRVVWTQEEPDGTIVGVEFLERLTDAPEGVNLDSSVEIAGPDLASQLGISQEKLEALLRSSPDAEAGRLPADPSNPRDDAVSDPPAAAPKAGEGGGR